MTKRKTGIISVIITVIVLVLVGFLLLSGGNYDIIKTVLTEEHTDDEIRDILSETGIRGYITIVILAFLQVILTFLPAEPVQVISGVAFGFLKGLILCTIGVVIGNTIIYFVYRIYGNRLRQYFVKNLHFDFDKAAHSRKIVLTIFILYFLPAIPYGMICFFAASVGMKYGRYITVTVLGALPSVCIGVGLGHMALSASWILSSCVFGVILILLVLALIYKKKIFAKVNEMIDKPPYSSKTTVRKYSPRKLILPYIISRIVFFLRGVKIKYTKKIEGEVDSPSMVLCNHGSFIDFAYAGTILRKKSPNFIVARLYFYRKAFGKLLKSFGCFPKSMFTQDLESIKNCLRAIKEGGVLAMMPEARLSTAGKFEDIQESTYDFIKKLGVNVYSIKICGDYLASPKWGDGLRRGARVEAELDILFRREELATLAKEEIKARVEERLSYNELEWLESKPEIRYKRKTLAKGLENILPICPKCKEKYTLSTQCRDVFCENCGKLATLDNRYKFNEGAPFSTFVEWYEWCSEQIKLEFSENPDYALVSEVELRLPSEDAKTQTRHAGVGTCTLNRQGLVYEGDIDGKTECIEFSKNQIYRLLFGAGENFELYVGNTIYYFKPKDPRSAVEWYIVSGLL